MKAGLYALEVSHKTARLAIRELLAARQTDLPALLVQARQFARESVILSTCGRFELYADTPLAAARLAELTGVSAELLATGLRVHAEIEAARHLLRVAAGLESPIMGEAHVLGQVRDAYLRAMQAESIGPVLSALFRAAIHAGKRVRSETPLGQAAGTYADLAVAQVFAATPADARVLLIGSGRLGEEVARALAARGPQPVTIVSRHARRADTIAAGTGARVAGYDSLPSELSAADAVVACTSSAEPVLHAGMLTERRRPLIVVDLGVPRNVAPEVGNLPGVQVKHLADLVGDTPLSPAIIEAAEAIVEEETARLQVWLAARRAHTKRVAA